LAKWAYRRRPHPARAANATRFNVDDNGPPGRTRRLNTGVGSSLIAELTTIGEIAALSRRNSNVRSLALSLGKKRTVTAECSDLLRALEETLARHHFAATR
jgi:hypothetical protein